MKCHDHGREPCTVPRCQVLALCALSVPSFAFEGVLAEWKWYRQHGYKRFLVDPALGPAMIADRLVAWMRWRGERFAGPVTMWLTGYDLSEDDHWKELGPAPGFWHRLDERLPYRERIRALSGTCPVCRGSGWHPVYGPVQHELQADGGYRPTPEGVAFRALHLPCDYDSIDWTTVLVLLDWLMDCGWTPQEVHEWRPRAFMADPLHRLVGAFAMPAAALGGAHDGAAAIDEEWRRIAVLLGGPASLLDAVRAGIHAQALKSHHSLLEIYRHAAEEIAAHGDLAAMWWASQREPAARPGSAEWYRMELAVLLANFHYTVDFAPGLVTVRICDSRAWARLGEWLRSCPTSDRVEIVVDDTVGPSARVRGV